MNVSKGERDGVGAGAKSNLAPPRGPKGKRHELATNNFDESESDHASPECSDGFKGPRAKRAYIPAKTIVATSDYGHAPRLRRGREDGTGNYHTDHMVQ